MEFVDEGEEEDELERVEEEDEKKLVEPERSEHAATRGNLFLTSTFAAWIGVAVFLVSFGVVINNTSKNGEPYIGTAMLSIGFLLLSLTSVVFFRANWPLQHKPYLVALLILIIALLLVVVAAAVRIWIPFSKPKLKPKAKHKCCHSKSTSPSSSSSSSSSSTS